eukprot:6108173-Pyramimonas_sp.AAC.1
MTKTAVAVYVDASASMRCPPSARSFRRRRARRRLTTTGSKAPTGTSSSSGADDKARERNGGRGGRGDKQNRSCGTFLYCDNRGCGTSRLRWPQLRSECMRRIKEDTSCGWRS